MRILYITQYFPPEIGATQTRAYEMARGLVRAGHKVTVLTEFPNHPHGVMPEAYRGKLVERCSMDGINVIRLWVKASPAKDFRNRMLFYLSFMLSATLGGLLATRGPFDVLYVTSPPLFVGGAGLALSLLRRTPMVFEVRDLWPESAVQLGQLRPGLALRLATRLEEACYRRARHLVLATEGIRVHLLGRGLPAAKMTVIPNGANTELYRPGLVDYGLRGKLNLSSGHFVVGYTGLLGLAHGLETVLEAARLLADDEAIRLLIVGDGPRKRHLEQLASDMQLNNVLFHPAVPETELPAYINMLDVGIDTRRKMGISSGTLPVKMFTYMACQKPVVLAIEGEAAELLDRFQAGIVVPPEDPPALVSAIRALKADPSMRERIALKGLDLVRTHYSRHRLAEKLDRLLREVIAKPIKELD
jgi:colanic acid biosynthesis glycosyl transferase WcaI